MEITHESVALYFVKQNKVVNGVIFDNVKFVAGSVKRGKFRANEFDTFEYDVTGKAIEEVNDNFGFVGYAVKVD